MEATLREWLGLLLRWIHIIAGIMWIGDSLLFMWIDSHLSPDPQGRKDVAGVTCLIRGGGYSQLENRLLVPGRLPPRLRWFWLEATGTWLSGFLLLILIYYISADAYLIDRSVRSVTAGQAIAVGLGMIVGGWLLYDGLWRTSLRDRPLILLPVSLALLAAAGYLATHVLSARAAFLHIGAMLGTIMAANVWVHILPPQYRMVQAARAGREIDYSLGVHAKTRSTHNTYFTFPVIFLMISQHFPVVFTAQPAWLVLILFFVLGAGARHIMLVGVRPAQTIAAATAAALVILVYLTARPVLSQRSTPPAVYGPVPSPSQVPAGLVDRSPVCHSETPVMPGFVAPPVNVKMDTPQQIRALAGRIRIPAVEQRTMPPGDITHITDEERALLRRLNDAGAPPK